MFEDTSDEWMDDAPEVARDDIMKRLAAYQQKVRAGLPSEEPEHSFFPSVLDMPATASAPFGAASPALEDAAPQIADPLSEPSQGPEWAPEPAAIGRTEAPPSEVWSWRDDPLIAPNPSPPDDLEMRLSGLEDTLASVDATLGDLRKRLDDLATTADESLQRLEGAADESRRQDDGTT